MFTGWNPIGTEASLSLKLRVWGSKSTVDRKTLSLNENAHSLGSNIYPLENEDFSVFWYLHVKDHC